MKIGVDYYPEHWDKSLWRADADLMKETGVKIVRMGEFAWSRLEPEEGKFDFSWLDEAVELFAERGIEVILCTPTNCPPLWLYEKYPDAVQTDGTGKKIATGIRGHRCFNDPDFLRLSARITDLLTKHYADNKAVTAWQIDNELEANECMCPRCTQEYREWLKEKYGSLEAINRAYGNSVWSGEYSSWEQIKPPFGTYPQAWLNPAYMLDWKRHAGESTVKFVRAQAQIIRKNCPDTNVTTNTWFCENAPDFYEMFKELDDVSFDNYPTTQIPESAEECYSHAFHLDFMRGVKRQNFRIMEQLGGAMGSWAPMSPQPEPGMIEGYALQAAAHGAQAVLIFRWRTAVSGAEMHWHGLIDHSGVPGRRFEEFKKLCERANSGEFPDELQFRAKAAILYSPDNDRAFKIQPQTNGMYYFEQMKLLHDAFAKFGLNVDIICEKDSFDGYEIIAAPEMYVTDETVARRLYDFASGGGTVIMTNRSGVKNMNNNCVMSQLPGVYRELVGAYAEEYDPIGYGSVNVRFDDGEVFACRQWCDILHTESARALAVYDGMYFKGKPAVTVNDYGSGRAYYIGTVGQKALYRRIVRQILNERGMTFTDSLPDNVELTTAIHGGEEIRFIFNNSGIEREFEFEGKTVVLGAFEMKSIQ